MLSEFIVTWKPPKQTKQNQQGFATWYDGETEWFNRFDGLWKFWEGADEKKGTFCIVNHLLSNLYLHARNCLSGTGCPHSKLRPDRHGYGAIIGGGAAA